MKIIIMYRLTNDTVQSIRNQYMEGLGKATRENIFNHSEATRRPSFCRREPFECFFYKKKKIFTEPEN